MSVKCHICGRELPDKFTKEADRWDWFTGGLPETVHFCPDHKQTRERDELFRKSRERFPEVPS